MTKKPKTITTLLKVDNVTLVARAEKDGKIRLTCGSWEDYRVVHPGQALELRREKGHWTVTLVSPEWDQGE